MPDIKITTPDGLIEATIKAKQETYYLVTEDNLSSLKQKSLLSDLFVLIASLAWGAYFSVVTTLKAIPLDTNPESATKNILQPLETLENIFLGAGILFSILAIVMIYFSFNQIQQLKKGKLELNDKDVPQGQLGQQTILILSATYEWPDGQVDVTSGVKELVAKGTFQGTVAPSTFGIADPIYGTVKTLKLHYKLNGQEKELIVKDGQSFKLK